MAVRLPRYTRMSILFGHRALGSFSTLLHVVPFGVCFPQPRSSGLLRAEALTVMPPTFPFRREVDELMRWMFDNEESDSSLEGIRTGVGSVLVIICGLLMLGGTDRRGSPSLGDADGHSLHFADHLPMGGGWLSGQVVLCTA